MIGTLRLMILVSAIVLAGSLLSTQPAWASHYDLASVDVVEEDIVAKLGRGGIRTTEDLWNETKTARQVTRLAKKLGVSTAKVKDWHDFCDLLRIKGVGPKVVRVLQLTGVQKISEMAVQDPGKLTARLKTTNTQYQILGKLPDDDSVRAWIDQARQMTKK